MSVLPMFYDFAREMENFTKRAFTDDFGLAIYPHDIFKPTPLLPIRNIFHPIFLDYPFESLCGFEAFQNDKEQFKIDKDGFQVSVDVNQYKPSELTVKTINNYVVVEGKHEERQDDHGYIQRQFVRKYLLPNGYNSEEVVATISSDGVLIVKVPPPQKSIDNQERTVRIHESGSPYLAIKDK